MKICDSRLRYRREAPFLNLFTKVLGDQRLDDFLLQLVGKAAANQTCRSLAAPKARYASHLLVAGNKRLEFARDSLGRNFNRELALALA